MPGSWLVKRVLSISCVPFFASTRKSFFSVMMFSLSLSGVFLTLSFQFLPAFRLVEAAPRTITTSNIGEAINPNQVYHSSPISAPSTILSATGASGKVSFYLPGTSSKSDQLPGTVSSIFPESFDYLIVFGFIPKADAI